MGRMNQRRRKVAAPGLRSRRVPARSRVTVRRSEAPLLRSTTLATALRDSRAALSSLEGELLEVDTADADRDEPVDLPV